MADELDFAKGGGIGAAVVAFVGVMWGAFMRRNEKAEDKVDADRDAKLMHLEKRLEGALKDHAERIRQLELGHVNHETRLSSREGRNGVQHTGVTRLTPEQQALLAQIKEESDD